MATSTKKRDVYVKAEVDSSILPASIFQAELEAIRVRRKWQNLPPPKTVTDHSFPDVRYSLNGLALSGGGIRSSTFNLGVIQYLEKSGLFARIDYLSTVSGGGYIGSCISSYWSGEDDTGATSPFPFQHQLGQIESRPFQHLRAYSSYLKPQLLLAGLRLPGIFLRGLMINGLLILPLLFFLAVITVFMTKEDIRYALNTKQLEYLLDLDTLREAEENLGMKQDEYLKVDVDLKHLLSWKFHAGEMNFLVDGLKDSDQTPYPGARFLGDGSWIIKKMVNEGEPLTLRFAKKQDYTLQVTTWQSNEYFSFLETRWGYQLRRSFPGLFDVYQQKTHIVDGAKLIPHQNEDNGNTGFVYTLKLEHDGGWQNTIVVSGAPHNSFSQEGDFLGDGRWLFAGKAAEDLVLRLEVPNIGKEHLLRISAWQSDCLSKLFHLQQDKKRVERLYFEGGTLRNLDGKEVQSDMYSFLKYLGLSSGAEQDTYLRIAHLPGAENIKGVLGRSTRLSSANNEWVFINDGIQEFLEHLGTVDTTGVTVENPMEIIAWQKSDQEKVNDPITYLKTNTFKWTKWFLLFFALILALYPLLQGVVHICTKVKPWQQRDFLTRYLCGGIILAIIVIAFCEFQPLAIYVFYSIKREINFANILGGFDKAITILGMGMTMCGGILAAASMGRGRRVIARGIIYFTGVIGPIVLWLFYLNFCGWILSSENVPEMFSDVRGAVICVFLFTAVLILLISSRFYNINKTSIHPFYRDRLSKAFLFTRDQKTGRLRHNDEQKLHTLDTRRAPYHILNTTLNISGKSTTRVKGRKAEFFMFSREYVGSPITGYVQTEAYETLDSQMGLGTAMAISAAAAAPNMGRETNRALTFIMALLNIRLGYWATNPLSFRSEENGLLRKISKAFQSYHVGPFYLFREMLGHINEKSRFINLSDGGHLENMGLHELVRRRCRYIIVSDAEADGKMTFHGFADAIRMVLIDMGIKIHIDLDHIYRKELNNKGELRITGTRHYAVGTIQYGDTWEEMGYLLYIKSSICGKHTPYIKEYLCKHPDFPHESTADQFFDESQFEAYRALGREIGEAIIRDLLTTPDMSEGQRRKAEVHKDQWYKLAKLQWRDMLRKARFSH